MLHNGFKIVFTFEGYRFYFRPQEGLIDLFSSLSPLGLIKKASTYKYCQSVILCKYFQKAELSEESTEI